MGGGWTDGATTIGGGCTGGGWTGGATTIGGGCTGGTTTIGGGWTGGATTTGGGWTGGATTTGGAAVTMPSAAVRTPRTRRVQPRPKVPQVVSPCRNVRRSSQICLISVAGSYAAVAAMVCGPISPSTSAPTICCSTLAARPMPEFTP